MKKLLIDIKFFIIGILFFSACQDIDDIGVLVPPTVDQDQDLPSISIEIDGVMRNIHTILFGDPANPLLIILHGTYSDTKPYIDMALSLSDKYYVLVYDQRGCGLSERITEEEFTIESAITEIDAVIKHYSPSNKTTLIGHSWGGAISTLYTSNYKDKIEQLILLEPMPLTGENMQEVFSTLVDVSYFEPMWNELAQNGQALSPRNHEQLDFKGRMILNGTATANYHCDGDNPPDWSVHRVGAFVEYVRYKRLGNPNKGFTYDFAETIKNFQEPVLILGGSCSSLGYDMQSQYSAPHFSDVEVRQIQNAGHRIHKDQFNLVINELKEFLNEY